jgi:hypothetical protein
MDEILVTGLIVTDRPLAGRRGTMLAYFDAEFRGLACEGLQLFLTPTGKVTTLAPAVGEVGNRRSLTLRDEDLKRRLVAAATTMYGAMGGRHLYAALEGEQV